MPMEQPRREDRSRSICGLVSARRFRRVARAGDCNSAYLLGLSAQVEATARPTVFVVIDDGVAAPSQRLQSYKDGNRHERLKSRFSVNGDRFDSLLIWREEPGLLHGLSRSG